MAKIPLGRLARSAFGMLVLPRLEAGVLEGFRALGDLTGTTSDAMDEANQIRRGRDPVWPTSRPTTWPTPATCW
jgi:hypothetical protein